jgi:capsular exopolysaccharide synthesis family protein
MTGEATPPKLVLVTSSVPKEGKTTVTAHLGASLARGGARVLLVDADLRRSTLHKVLGAGLKPGLREVLNQTASLEQAVVATQEPNLFLLPAGDGRNSSSDVFLRTPVAELFRRLAADYDYVIVDTAPVLATDDATTLGPGTDGVFVVVRAAYTSSRMTREALDRLHRRRIKVLGVIYNRAQAAEDYYHRYSGDYHDTGEVVVLPTAAVPKVGGSA